MRKNSKWPSCSLVIFLIVLTASLLSPVRTSAQDQTDADKPKYDSAILIDAETGQVLYEYNADQKHIPASLVKMMLMLLTVETFEHNTFSPDQKVTVSREASQIGGSQVYLKQGEVFTLGELLKAVVIASGNDAAYAIAEHLAGTPGAMVELMNERARELGMTATTYTNVHGLPPGPGQKQDYTSARDVAILGREITKHPLLLKWGATYRDTFRNGEFTLWNTNKLVRTFEGMDGIKTGHYEAAGWNLCATAERGGLRLISVVLGAPEQKDRVRETRRLLTEGFRVYKRVTFFNGDKPVREPVPVAQGKKKAVPVGVAQPISLLVKRIHLSKVKTRIQLKENPIPAPVQKGDPVGQVELVAGKEVLASTPLLAMDNIARKTWLDRIMFWKD